MARDEGAEIDVRESVAGDDQEGLLAEELRAGAHAAGGAQQLLLVAVGEAIAEVLADGVGEVVQVGDHLLEAVAVEQVEDVRHHRPVEHRHHRLGDLIRQRAQARAEAGREDHRFHRLDAIRSRRLRCDAPRSVAVVVGLVRARRRARRCRRPARRVSLVSLTPSASRCSRATFSSRCLGST